MRDPYFGNRDWFTGEPSDTPDVWTDWDYALSAAFQVIQDYTDSNGVLAWENEADNVEVLAERKISKFDAAREVKTSGKNYKAQKGERWTPRVRKMNGEWPTFSDWVAANADEGD